jgi:hypothetical protein
MKLKDFKPDLKISNVTSGNGAVPWPEKELKRSRTRKIVTVSVRGKLKEFKIMLIIAGI